MSGKKSKSKGVVAKIKRHKRGHYMQHPASDTKAYTYYPNRERCKFCGLMIKKGENKCTEIANCLTIPLRNERD